MGHRTMDIGHQTWDVEHRTSDMLDIWHEMLDIGHRISNIEYQTWDIKHSNALLYMNVLLFKGRFISKDKCRPTVHRLYLLRKSCLYNQLCAKFHQNWLYHFQEISEQQMYRLMKLWLDLMNSIILYERLSVSFYNYSKYLKESENVCYLPLYNFQYGCWCFDHSKCLTER